jgi:hypothetical protein
MELHFIDVWELYNGNLLEGSAMGKPSVEVPRLYCSSEQQNPSEIKVHGAAYQ